MNNRAAGALRGLQPMVLVYGSKSCPYIEYTPIKPPRSFFQISRVVDIESSSKSLRMGLVDRLTISAPKKMRTRPLDGSDLGHPVTTDISGEFGSESAILDWL